MEKSSLDIVAFTIDKVQEGYASSSFTCVELTQAFIDRIKRYNSHYNAVIFLDECGALEEARRIDSFRSSGKPLGPLAGVPIVVKVKRNHLHINSNKYNDTFGEKTLLRNQLNQRIPWI